MNYNFQTAADLLSICGSEKLSLAEVMIGLARISTARCR